MSAMTIPPEPSKGPPISFEQLSQATLFRFCACAAKRKDDILLAQPSDHPLNEPPHVLPPAIVVLLSRICNIPQAVVIDCWENLKDIVWHEDEFSKLDSSREALYHQYGQDLGFRMLFVHSFVAMVYQIYL
jgi:hypothetical protein